MQGAYVQAMDAAYHPMAVLPTHFMWHFESRIDSKSLEKP